MPGRTSATGARRTRGGGRSAGTGGTLGPGIRGRERRRMQAIEGLSKGRRTKPLQAPKAKAADKSARRRTGGAASRVRRLLTPGGAVRRTLRRRMGQ